ncbi:uncharacterized protein I303_107024 [Kwoniella dejecticola CBS 10117]|uniref:Zn(2)-C6 fungal-type domain-containing protein n=1 Tax=Kwoniella dejecticola CBS 10117 TaxID=1296121 RepID=A0A1A5ZYJ8_9TREE|nr:uncharacterized protein I303_06425 [Kwoniella dejecticola CBS 10117]OBR82868.1 hypothetical protein I303_06425 [Kwoniella dejecticola CBS 10117]
MDDQSMQTAQQQADNDALASAVAAASAHLGSLGHHTDQDVSTVVMDDDQLNHHHQPHHFHHALQQPDFSQHQHKEEQLPLDHHDLHNGSSGDLGVDVNVNVHDLEIPIASDDNHLHHQQHHEPGVVGMEGEPELDLNLGDIHTPNEFDPRDTDLSDFDNNRPNSFGRPPSIRKACDLCHAAKQKCSGDRPSCTRCAAGGWNCIYAPRQRRRTVPKDQKMAHQALDPMQQHHALPHANANNPGKKRKLGARESLSTFGSEAMDMKMAMGMAMDMGLTGEEEGEELQTMTDDQMLESIAIDGYLADLPLALFVHNLPYNAPPQPEPQVHYNNDDFPSAGDNPFPNTDMDQHTTSALRDAIFSLNENNAGGHGDGNVEGDHGGDAHEMDPHLALLNLTSMQDDNDGSDTNVNSDPAGLQLPDFSVPHGCNHRQVVPHILSLLTQHALDPKPGMSTPLTLGVFAPLARSLRLFHSLTHCPNCSASPQQTLPQLALLSRTTTMLTFPCPPINSFSVGSSAQITIQGARLSGTGLSEAIEQHIVNVVWDSWRASIREIFAALDKKAEEVIKPPPPPPQPQAKQENNSENGEDENGGAGGGGSGRASPQAAPPPPPPPPPPASSLEKQRAGLIFQAISRLVTAMDEVEG